MSKLKDQHEWTSADDMPCRVVHDGSVWVFEYYGSSFSGGRKWIRWYAASNVLAAEIARLAGLTKPEGEGRGDERSA